MNANQLRLSALVLPLMVTAACGQADTSKEVPNCPISYPPVAVTDTAVLKVTPSKGMMGRHLQIWLQVPAQRPNLDNLQLYIDGHPIPGLRARQIGPRCAVRNPPTGPVMAFREVHEFVPVRTDASREMWAHLLGSPTRFVDTVRVGAGLVNGPEFKRASETQVNNVVFRVVEKRMLWVASLLFLGLLALLVWAGATTWILRDPTPLRPEPDTPRPGPPAPQQPPFSLARVVMAMWTFLILAGFFGIWLITGDHHGILTAQSLLLLGIVGVAGAVSNAITLDKDKPVANDIRELRLEAMALRGEAKALNEAAAARAGQIEHAGILNQARERAELAAATEIALRTAEAQAPASQGFFIDLISDANGPALYRFQNLLWNVVLSFVFILGTYRALAFPEFDATLMTLIGISEGLYLGLKLPAPPKPGADEGNPPAAKRWWKRVLVPR